MNTRRPPDDPRPGTDALAADALAAEALAAEARAQAAAESGAGIGADAAADRYRAVYRAIRSAPMPSPPPTFALQMERLVGDHAERAAIEAWLMRLLPALAVVAILATLGAAGGAVVDGLRASLSEWQGLPWPVLAATGGGLAGAWALDRWLGRRAGPSTAH